MRPRVLDYDALHDYLEAKHEDELAAVNEYRMDERSDLADLHGARSEALQEVINYIEYTLEFGS